MASPLTHADLARVMNYRLGLLDARLAALSKSRERTYAPIEVSMDYPVQPHVYNTEDEEVMRELGERAGYKEHRGKEFKVPFSCKCSRLLIQEALRGMPKSYSLKDAFVSKDTGGGRRGELLPICDEGVWKKGADTQLQPNDWVYLWLAIVAE